MADKPRLNEGAAARKARLAQELRANLLRRKAQARSRKSGDKPAPKAGTAPGDRQEQP